MTRLQAIRHFPFTGEPHRIQMGLKPLDPRDWIEFDVDYAAQMSLKRRLLKDRQEEVLIVQPAAEMACLELHELLLEHLQSHYPERAKVSGRPITGAAALAEMAEWVQEDFALLTPAPARLLAACVCFPSRWKLSAKIGQGMPGIHQPVPNFTLIEPTAVRFVDQLQDGKPMWRVNWTLHDSAELFCPVAVVHEAKLNPDNVLDKTYLRLERQTLRRLRKSRFVAFSIRTYSHSLRSVLADPQRHRQLKKTLETLPKAVANYKGMGHFFETLLAAL